MEWKLDDSRPIWMQLEEQLTRRILSGWYKPGEKLPTVRDLAAEAGVNPNTLQRALAAVDGEGLSIPRRKMKVCWKPCDPDLQEILSISSLRQLQNSVTVKNKQYSFWKGA